MADSKIEWTQKTWNPTTGCDKVSQGCKYCYAEVMAERLRAMGVAKYRNGFSLTLHPEELDVPRRWKKPAVIFVNSMSDLFHDDVPVDFLRAVFRVMSECPHHTFQVLTKRAERLAELSPLLTWPPNVWMGVSVENESVAWRISYLQRTSAAVKFLSVEPMLGPLPNPDLTGIGWVIVGGESGPKARPMREEWVQDLLLRCDEAGVAFFFKQWGGRNKKAAGRTLNGRTYDAMPREISRSLVAT